MLPHLEGAGLLSSVACLRARLRFDEGRDAEATQDIIDAMTLSRHITLGGVNIMLIWGYSLENRVSQTLAIYLPKLSAGMIKDLNASGRPTQERKAGGSTADRREVHLTSQSSVRSRKRKTRRVCCPS